MMRCDHFQIYLILHNTMSNSSLDNNKVIKHITTTAIKKKFKSLNSDLSFCIFPITSDGIVLQDLHYDILENEYISHGIMDIACFFNDSLNLLLKHYDNNHYIISFGIYNRIHDKFGITYFLSTNTKKSEIQDIYNNIFDNTIGIHSIFEIGQIKACKMMEKLTDNPSG